MRNEEFRNIPKVRLLDSEAVVPRGPAWKGSIPMAGCLESPCFQDLMFLPRVACPARVKRQPCQSQFPAAMRAALVRGMCRGLPLRC